MSFKHYFVPAGRGVRIHLKGCSFYMNPKEIDDLVEWLVTGRPDPRPELEAARQQAWAEREARRADEREDEE